MAPKPPLFPRTARPLQEQLLLALLQTPFKPSSCLHSSSLWTVGHNAERGPAAEGSHTAPPGPACPWPGPVGEGRQRGGGGRSGTGLSHRCYGSTPRPGHQATARRGGKAALSFAFPPCVRAIRMPLKFAPLISGSCQSPVDISLEHLCGASRQPPPLTCPPQKLAKPALQAPLPLSPPALHAFCCHPCDPLFCGCPLKLIATAPWTPK